MSARSEMDALQRIFQHNKAFYDGWDLVVDDDPKCFRLLFIVPGAFADPLECALVPVQFSMQMSYAALSYAWGDKQGCHEISVNGKTGFQVTRQLYAALRRLRPRLEGVVPIWIDALCINQASDNERSAQIAVIAEIYRNAIHVYVYLGPCIHGRAKDAELETCFLDGPRGALCERPICDGLSDLDVDPRDKSQWWWRLWTVQEVVLGPAPIFLVGPHAYRSWDLGSRAFETGTGWEQLPEQLDTTRALHAAIVYFDGNFGFSTLELIAGLADFHTSEPKDMIYGCLGLLNSNRNVPVLKADYSKPFEYVCYSTTMAVITRDQSLDVLYSRWSPLDCSQRPKSSWIADFSKPHRSPTSLHVLQPVGPDLAAFARMWRDEPTKSNASRSTKPLIVEHTQTALTVRGVQFDQVDVTVLKSQEILDEARHFIVHGADETLIVEQQSRVEDGVMTFRAYDILDPTSEILLDRLGDCAMQSFDKIAEHAQERASSALDPRSFRRKLYASFTDTVSDYMVGTKQDLMYGRGLTFWANKILRHRSFFTTDTGFVGVGSAEIRKGDIVGVLLGASMPVILRPVEHSGEAAYELIGECLVSGVMNGELMDFVYTDEDLGTDPVQRWILDQQYTGQLPLRTFKIV